MWRNKNKGMRANGVCYGTMEKQQMEEEYEMKVDIRG